MGVSRREDGPLREDTVPDASAARAVESSRGPSSTPAKRLELGDVVAERYVVERVLGLGGMGQVLAARHVKLGTMVAIKAVHPELAADAQAVARFLREAQAMARLASEHTVRVHDVGELPGGVPYMIMEHLDGRDLGALLAEHGPLPVPLALEYIRQACEALAEAHAAGIIHRDVKPQNLFVTRRANGAEVVRVLDFGLAKPMQSPDQLTRAGCVIGTAQYMAPEQLSLRGTIDARTDVWSVGATLFRLLTRQYPFQEANPAAAVAAILTREPARVRSLRPDVPDAVAEIVDRCLSRDPARRFQSIRELADAIDHARLPPPSSSMRIFVAQPPPSMPMPMAMPTVMPAPAPASNAPLYVSIALLAFLLLGGAMGALVLAKKRSTSIVPPAAAAAVQNDEGSLRGSKP